jgi:transposase
MYWPMMTSLSSTCQDSGHSVRSGPKRSSAPAASAGIMAGWLTLLCVLLMLLTRLLNACHRFPGFVYEGARLNGTPNTIEIDVRPRRGSKPHCPGCGKPARGYDRLSERCFEFIPIWGFAVVLLYSMGRVECTACGVKVEEVPWGIGKHTLTRAYMLYLAH